MQNDFIISKCKESNIKLQNKNSQLCIKAGGSGKKKSVRNPGYERNVQSLKFKKNILTGYSQKKQNL